MFYELLSWKTWNSNSGPQQGNFSRATQGLSYPWVSAIDHLCVYCSAVPPLCWHEPPARQQPGSQGPQAGQHHEVHQGRRLCRLQADGLWGGAGAAGRSAVCVRDRGVPPPRHVRESRPQVSSFHPNSHCWGHVLPTCFAIFNSHCLVRQMMVSSCKHPLQMPRNYDWFLGDLG